jgi:hypothetical protein
MHFGERHPQLFPFCEYVLASGNSPVEVHFEVPDSFFFRKIYAVYMDWKEGFSSCSISDVDQLKFPHINKNSS